MSMLRLAFGSVRALSAVVCLALAASCNGQRDAAASAPPALVGTTWRLIAFESSDDAIGRVVPSDPSAYVMSLGQDGEASFRLSCNQGSGSWKAEASGPDSGTFTIEGLAMTEMACPEPSLDGRFANDAQHVRSYALREGRLYLNLLADGGAYVWEPSPGP